MYLESNNRLRGQFHLTPKKNKESAKTPRSTKKKTGKRTKKAEKSKTVMSIGPNKDKF